MSRVSGKIRLSVFVDAVVSHKSKNKNECGRMSVLK